MKINALLIFIAIGLPLLRCDFPINEGRVILKKYVKTNRDINYIILVTGIDSCGDSTTIPMFVTRIEYLWIDVGDYIKFDNESITFQNPIKVVK